MTVLEDLMLQLESISDPRVVRRSQHNLLDVLVIAVVSVLCQAETFVDIEEFGKAKATWFSQFLSLPNGVPSHDTFRRIMMIVNPEELELAFVSWVNSCRKNLGVEEVFVIDGKSNRGTVSTGSGPGRTKLHLVNVWNATMGLAIGQNRSLEAGNAELKPAMELLDLFELDGITVVADAGLGKPSLAEKVVDAGGNYVFPIKKNLKIMHSKVEEFYSNIAEKDSLSKKVECYSVLETSHGRQEARHYSIIKDSTLISKLNKNSKEQVMFKNLYTIGRVVYESKEKETRPFEQRDGAYHEPGKVRAKKEIRYFVTSANAPIEKQAQLIRQQWSIENSLHWVLDVNFNEDANRTREKTASRNLSVIRKIGLNLAKQDPTKMGVKRKLKKAGWDSKYLEFLLFKTELS